ncbi:hypothetical protein [Devosia submarina]|uniref:hypothetical protein n=1 Tax=Devosia submarina TaxID=1173082 RepID=UPI000D39448F|nr:hypothetical protein [Devosia submarina]
MAELRVPTLQHLARNWRADPVMIASALVRLVENPPIFNYNPLFGAIRDLLVLHVPYDQIVTGISKIKREDVRKNLLSILPLVRDHFADVHPDFCQVVERRFYPVGRGLMVPFEQPMMYGVGGQLYFPWFSFWRTNPLAAERLSLFVTLVDEVLLQDPDLETARFEILDFSAPNAKASRELTIMDARDIPRVHEARKVEMLDTFAEGYFLALERLKGRTPPPPADDYNRAELDQPRFPGFPE